MQLIPVRPALSAAAAFILTAFLALPALSLPAPMSDEELMENSDLVALVRVMSVTCTSITKDPQTGEELPGYLAKLRVIEASKGDVRPGGEVLVTFRAIPSGALGPWTVFYYPGEEVWTHLVKREGGVTYATTWWNAKGDVVKAPETKELPTTVGESAVATDAD
ncbi:MAG: hypothetical protein ACSLE4_12430 [Methyloceanibacter sp.]|uniref:hypothetical protein n=1 Tax=Methyloceanibacter sp. TaxID=1965321 RepID=UPI003EE21ADE